MELLPCAVLLLALALTGSDAQLDVCGVAPLNNRIVGGQTAAEGAWPWQASLHRSGSHFCGGSLINNQWVLTAAHCFYRMEAAGVVVYLGRHSQKNSNPNELVPSIKFTDYIRPVCLAAQGSNFSAGMNVWLTGWGDIQNNIGLPYPQNLQEVKIPVVSSGECSISYSDIVTITSNMICAGLTDGGKDSCQGDSGGPMVSKSSSVWVQAGIVSFGEGCAEPKYPGVYTRVSEYQSWINSQITTNRPGFVTFEPSAGSDTRASLFISLSVPLLLSILPVLS